MSDTPKTLRELSELVEQLEGLAESLHEAAFSFVRLGYEDQAEQVESMAAVSRIYSDKVKRRIARGAL